jgi:hypothetical protein
LTLKVRANLKPVREEVHWILTVRSPSQSDEKFDQRPRRDRSHESEKEQLYWLVSFILGKHLASHETKSAPGAIAAAILHAPDRNAGLWLKIALLTREKAIAFPSAVIVPGGWTIEYQTGS